MTVVRWQGFLSCSPPSIPPLLPQSTTLLLLQLVLLSSLSSLLTHSANGIQYGPSEGSTSSPCSCPYSCISLGECANRHAGRGTDEVIFYCEETGKVCCPPVQSQERPGAGPAKRRDTLIDIRYNYDCGGKGDGGPSRTRGQTQGDAPDKEFYHVPSAVYVHTEEYMVKHESYESANGPAENSPKKTGWSGGGYRPQSKPKKPKNSLKSHRNYGLLPRDTSCGVNNFSNRITEGEEVSLGEYPWMVLTGLKDKYGHYRWNCGGTLINGWYVLTAAHCLRVDNRTIEYVRLGEHSLSNATDCIGDVCLDPAEDIAIAEVIPHEKWNTTTIKNDIALLRLSRNPLLAGKSNIYPICLPLEPEKLNLTATSKYEIAGWGKTDWNDDEGSNVLRKASISGVGRDECNICRDKKKQQYCPIGPSQLCVQGWKAVDVCKGDSGGPLMATRSNIYQIGITSFKGSEYCGAENIPSIFTRVESYLPWILDNIRE